MKFIDLPVEEQLARMRVQMEVITLRIHTAKTEFDANPSSWTKANLETAEYKLEYASAYVAMLNRKEELEEAARVARGAVPHARVLVDAFGRKGKLVFGIIVYVPAAQVYRVERRLAALIKHVPFKVEQTDGYTHNFG